MSIYLIFLLKNSEYKLCVCKYILPEAETFHLLESYHFPMLLEKTIISVVEPKYLNYMYAKHILKNTYRYMYHMIVQNTAILYI